MARRIAALPRHGRYIVLRIRSDILDYAMKKLLVTLLLLSCSAPQADGVVYSGVTKPVECTNPTKREDGTALNVSDIERALIGFSQESKLTVAPKLYVTMPGGCKSTTYVLSKLPAEGQWYEYGWSYACDVPMTNGMCPPGKGRYSAPSAPLPFVYEVPVVSTSRPEAVVPVK